VIVVLVEHVFCSFKLIDTGLLFRRSGIPKVHCADTHHSAEFWVKVKVRVRVSLRVRLRVSGNSRLSE